MEQGAIDRYFELLEAGRAAEAEQVAAEQMAADPTDSTPICLVADMRKQRGDLDGAEDLYVQGYSTELENGSRVYALAAATEGVIDTRRLMKNFKGAFNAIGIHLELGLPIRNSFSQAALSCVFEAGGIGQLDAAGRNLLYAVTEDEYSEMADKEKSVAFIFSKMAELQIEKRPDGTFRNLDPTMAGTLRLRRYCGIPWSYVTIMHGAQNPAGEDMHLLVRVMTPWRVSNGQLSGDPVPEMPTDEVPEIRSRGMLGLDECVSVPPRAPWAQAVEESSAGR